MRWSLFAFALVIGLMSVQPAEAGVTERLWQLEKRKNAWLKRTFLPGGSGAPRVFRG